MIFTHAFEFVAASGIQYDVEVKVDQYDEYFSETQFEPSTFTDILDIKVFNEFGEDITEDMNSDELSEIEEYAYSKDYSEEE